MDASGARAGARDVALSPASRGWKAWVAAATTLALAGYLFVTAYFGTPPNIQHRSLVLAACLIVAFVHFRAGRGTRIAWYDWLLALGSLAACVHVFVNYWAIMTNPRFAGPIDYVLGAFLVVAILELSRRCVDSSFTILVGIFVAYALFGDLLPGRLGHGPLSWEFLVENMYLTTNGIWGELMAIFVEVIALFLIFSAVMIATGADRVVIAAAMVLGGRFRGGPAKICVISSAMVGTISGSSVTNAAMVGNVTIPMMKRIGYRPEVAAAIEATASSGGQITPPLMGAGLFLMAQLLNVGVTDIMIAAVVPAFLFYVGVLSAVHFDAVRDRMSGVPAGDIGELEALSSPRVWFPVALPFAVLLWLVLDGYSIELSVVAAVMVLVAAILVTARSPREAWGRFDRVVRGLANAGPALVSMAVLLAASALLVGLMDVTGVGVKLTELTLRLSSGTFVGTLLLSAFVVLVLGLGLPTTASYLIAAALGATALRHVGLTDLQAHMFLFYFATLSAISPPVAPAVFVAAGIAEASPLLAMLHTMRFAMIKYVLPFGMALNQALLLQGGTLDVLLSVATAVVGTVFLSAGFSGYLFARLWFPLRIACALGGMLCFFPPGAVTLVGLAIVGAVALANWHAKRGAPAVPR
ncbi:MAG: TRAP transporter fused permease subunit [Alphaproteobacteria bacterium]|nr:TRAP transporter fused permease subunit [Alphaproteobacteria bacterium]